MELNRAYSLLEIKSVDDEKRVISGMATTPETDRMGDIVDPMGAKFAAELPLLWQHQHDKPVGVAKFGKPTKSGIPFTASIAHIADMGPLKDLVDMAWQSVKAKLVRGVSIGFRSIEHSYMDGGGIKFSQTEVYELSLVTIPANASATIQTIKSIDCEQRGASRELPVVRTAPGASGNKAVSIKPKPQEGNNVNIAEQIKALEATRADKSGKLNAIQQKAVDEGRTKDASEREEFDSLREEIKSIDAELVDLRALEEDNKVKAVPAPIVTGGSAAASASRGGDVTVKTVEKLDPGIAFARYAMCLTKAKGNHDVAFRLAERHYPQTEDVVRTLKAQSEGADLAQMFQQRAMNPLSMKAAVAAGTSTDSTWAGPLVYAQTFMGDFINYLRPRTLIGQAQFRPVPFNVRIGGQTSGGTANWVGQGKAKPVTKFDFNATTVPFTKVAAIAVITQELARFSDPSAEALVRDSLGDCVIAKVDNDLFDPDVAAVANVNPAGLLNGVSPVVPAAPIDYTDPDSIRCAIGQLWAPWDSTNIGARPAYYTTPAVARHLSMVREALGTVAFPGVTMTGGTLDGVPLRVSQYLANNGGSGGAPFILVDESEVYLADDGTVTLDQSDQVSLEMSDAPAHDSSTPTAAQLVSMWQTNSIAFRAERFIWWGARRSGAVQWIDGFPTSC